MVKVKVEDKVAQDAAGVGFNHPMVKVKGIVTHNHRMQNQSFNHPMVKVKVFTEEKHIIVNSFNHPMVKVKVR